MKNDRVMMVFICAFSGIQVHDKFTNNARCDPSAGLLALIIKAILDFEMMRQLKKLRYGRSSLINVHMASFMNVT